MCFKEINCKDIAICAEGTQCTEGVPVKGGRGACSPRKFFKIPPQHWLRLAVFHELQYLFDYRTSLYPDFDYPVRQGFSTTEMIIQQLFHFSLQKPHQMSGNENDNLPLSL